MLNLLNILHLDKKRLQNYLKNGVLKLSVLIRFQTMYKYLTLIL